MDIGSAAHRGVIYRRWERPFVESGGAAILFSIGDRQGPAAQSAAGPSCHNGNTAGRWTMTPGPCLPVLYSVRSGLDLTGLELVQRGTEPFGVFRL